MSTKQQCVIRTRGWLETILRVMRFAIIMAKFHDWSTIIFCVEALWKGISSKVYFERRRMELVGFSLFNSKKGMILHLRNGIVQIYFVVGRKNISILWFLIHIVGQLLKCCWFCWYQVQKIETCAMSLGKSTINVEFLICGVIFPLISL